MKKLAWLITLLVMILGLGFTLIGGSCQRPMPWEKAYCHEIEQTILDSTVQIVFHGWLEVEDGYETEKIWGTRSYATVIDGRYLLTHNHFGLPLSQIELFNQNSNGSLSGLSIFSVGGTAVMDHAPLDVFVVTAEKGETVILDFGLVEGKGFFTQAGLYSAEVAYADNLKLSSGVLVAQIDRDESGNAEVVWTTIRTIYENEGSPIALVDNFIEKGASGGGIFLNGQHVGNNWAHVGQSDSGSNTVQPGSLVALNTHLIQK